MTKETAAAFKFDSIKKRTVKKSVTAEYRVRGVQVAGKVPVLTVRPATEVNRIYFDEVLKRSKHRIKDIQRGNISADDIKQGRDEDRELYPKLVITGWKDVLDDLEREVPFNKHVCADFIAALPDDVFDDLRNFCGQIDNFRDTAGLDSESEGNV